MNILGKTLIAGVVAGGVMISGITWLGEEPITNIRGNIDNIQSKLELAIEDNEFLQGSFDALKDLYQNTTNQANTTIGGLNETISDLWNERDGLLSQIALLEQQLEEQDGDLVDARDELQAEIDRLENELERANQQILELEQYAQQVDDAVTYEPLNRESFVVEELELVAPIEETVDEEPAPTEPDPEEPTEPEQPSDPVDPEEPVEIFITQSALEYKNAPWKAETMASDLWVNRLQAEFDVHFPGLKIVGVDTYYWVQGGGHVLAYVVEPATIKVVSSTPEMFNVLGAISETYLMFVYEDGTTAKGGTQANTPFKR